MRNKFKKIKIIKILFLLSACFFTLCSNSCNTLKGQNGISSNIKESKKREVFICEYEPKQNPYIINDSLKIHVKSAWLEKKWKYPKSLNETVIIKYYQLIVNTDSRDTDGMRNTWTIGIDEERYFYVCGRECIVSEFKEFPNESFEVWKVEQGFYLDDLGEHEIIGEFSLKKK